MKPATSLLRIHQFAALHSGPRLIVLGAVHGNETCGTLGIQRILGELDSGTLQITRGTVTFVPITNPLAYAKQQRAGDRNLNRNLRPSDKPQDYEDHIANVLCPLLAAHEVLLDLHSFHTAGALCARTSRASLGLAVGCQPHRRGLAGYLCNGCKAAPGTHSYV
jgi:predicted deacylase